MNHGLETQDVNAYSTERHSRNATDGNKSRSTGCWKICAIITIIAFLMYVCATCCMYQYLSGQYASELTNYSVTLNDSRKEVERLEEAKVQLQNKINQLERKNSRCADKLTDRDSEVKHLKTDYSYCETSKNKCEKRNLDQQTTINEMTTQANKLEKQNDKLAFRLSEAIGDNVDTGDGVSKMEADSPIKLAEQFQEIYDNDYTLAYEELENMASDLSVQGLTKQLLDILQLADRLCKNYSTNHLTSIKRSITGLSVHIPAFSPKQPCSQNMATENTNSTCLIRNHWTEILINRTCSKEDMPHTKAAELVTVNEDSVSSKDWKQILDLRRKFAYKFQDSLLEILLDVIARDFDINLKSLPGLRDYTHKCLHICWQMSLRKNPLCIKFFEIHEKTIFDTNTFRPFMRSGRYIDYVTWPPLYLHEGGVLLVKGVADGKA